MKKIRVLFAIAVVFTLVSCVKKNESEKNNSGKAISEKRITKKQFSFAAWGDPGKGA